MYRLLTVILIITLSNTLLFSQDKITLNGYISQMGQCVVAKNTSNTYNNTWDYLLHNRINSAYTFNLHFKANLQFRNQFIAGQSVKNNQNYAADFSADRGFFDLNFNWFTANSSFLNTQIDRANIEFNYNKLEITLGRQRINWGRTLVWNPNDIFNAYSYYDFDYSEKPGSDAVRFNYYTNNASSVELVAKADSSNNISVAVLRKFNKWGFDMQILGAFVNNQDFMIGSGWEGNVAAMAFRGEWSYYHPKNNFTDTTGVFLASLSLDYLFPHNITAQFEFLYNDSRTVIDLAQQENILKAPASSKSLSFSELNFYGNISWQATPILTLNLAGMYYPDYNGYFLMPGVDLSLSENLYLSLIYQYFNLEVYNSRNDTHMGFMRFKWNF